MVLLCVGGFFSVSSILFSFRKCESIVKQKSISSSVWRNEPQFRVLYGAFLIKTTAIISTDVFKFTSFKLISHDYLLNEIYRGIPNKDIARHWVSLFVLSFSFSQLLFCLWFIVNLSSICFIEFFKEYFIIRVMQLSSYRSWKINNCIKWN